VLRAPSVDAASGALCACRWHHSPDSWFVGGPFAWAVPGVAPSAARWSWWCLRALSHTTRAPYHRPAGGGKGLIHW